MRVRLQPPNAKDKLFLINVDTFNEVVDYADLARRNSLSIENAYHEHWLSRCPDGSYLFHAPEFYMTRGRAKFINGRHRYLTLSRHVAEIPMALAGMDGGYPLDGIDLRQAGVPALAGIFLREVVEDEVFWFPDLPVRYLGYDDNIGK